ncbi:LytTR family DNA-binding domain-containing protein [Coprobacillus cateniformis]|uniref:LytTR family DNA-binding domain-containing protein n=1 Tax=Coprobacillus cateniformis TaxID=100884 RepID=UPI0024A884DF|nr:LytTR family DNA-binding domain-containing protein [Coprobacillus cateniformis]
MKIKNDTKSLSIGIEFDSFDEKDKVLASIQNMNTKIPCYKREKKYLLNIDSIYYIDLIDKNIENEKKQVFIFTKDDCFESPLWLYQIEELLNEDFIRASKSTLFNMQHIKSLKADIGSRVIVYLDNGDQILVSRKYAKEFKKRLGGV